MTIEDPSLLAALGWDAGWAAALAAASDTTGEHRHDRSADGTADFRVPARVVAEHRDRYVVATTGGTLSAVLSGRMRHKAASRDALPAVGDWVVIANGPGGGADAGGATIRRVLPRRSAFVRKVAGDASQAQVVAANVDVALIATALPADLNARRLERYLTLAWESGATPVIVLTKADLCNDVPAAIAEAAGAAPGVDVVAVSAATGAGVDALARYLVAGHTAVLLGSSGVGKSTLINALLGAQHLRTATLAPDGRGRHTTTHRELVPLASGALLIDTPGMRELQLWNADSGLGSAFADVDGLAEGCRFRDCGHDGEPGCAVAAAAARGELDAARLEHWHRLRRELAYLARKQDELAAADAKGRARSLTRAARARVREKYGDS